MDCQPLVVANRRLIEALETPPDSGLERRIDEVAAAVWELADGPEPDPGACCRLRQKLRSLERRAGPHRAGYVEQARRTVEVYGETLDPV